ncbi:haloacid dehalogenase type II [Saccharopolyspora erythraea]|uniref:haloacid dehalogenase type II n=1 Tax=Saccharopolyspora erythraea TaxID=1836 RepID=UPI001BA4BF20|nr:haloacid dehalogenase type II [Saccharopolyspora erythraea]QUH03489.1 haloacid dehalogenase type II [Saccharopolyspora erythraea]
MPARPRVVAFDVVETLMSLEPLCGRFAEVGLAPELVPRWFDRTLRDGMALTLAGDYATFPEVGASALRTLAAGSLDEDAVAHVMGGFATLPAQPDAEPAMRVLSGAGITVVCLSNGTAETTTGFLERSGLSGYVEQVISVADVRSWKPPRRVYEYALELTGCSAGEVFLVAVHAFDCHGAKRAGLGAGWAGRLEGHYAEVFTPADVVGRDLVEVASRIAALPR